MAGTVCRLHSEVAEAAFRHLGADAPVAASRAINRALRSAKVVVGRLTAKDVGLTVGDVRKVLYEREALPARLTAKLSAGAKRLPLIKFAARGPYPSRGRGVVTAMSSGGRKRYPHAFIAQMPSGHRGVFRRDPNRRMRRQPRRQAIVELHGPSIAHVAVKYASAGVTRGEMQLAKTMSSELKFAIRSSFGRSGS